MRIALIVHVVNAVHHLVEVGPGHSLGELAAFGYKVKELASASVFQDDGKAIDCWLVGFFIYCRLFNCDKFDEILMNKLFHDCQFFFECFEGGGLMFVLLDSHVFVFDVDSQFYSMHVGTRTLRNSLLPEPLLSCTRPRIRSLPSYRLPFKINLYNRTYIPFLGG
jgi:hypothetical protein